MLTGLSWLYAKVMDARNSLYARNLIATARMPAPTVSIGNITVGGTGKTPLVEYTARYLASKGEKVCIISRGYGRKGGSKRVLVSDSHDLLAAPSEAGDEPAELAVRLLGKAYVVADPDRVAAARWAFEKFGITVFVLDDAFQHRRAGRDLNIAVVDATNPFGNYETLPTGILRERPANLGRADLVVISRANLCEEIEAVERRVRHFAPETEILVSRNQTSGFRQLEGFISGDPALKNTIREKAFAFCGLGNSSGFFNQLTGSGIEIVGTREFRDHHRYKAKDVEDIQRLAEGSGAEVLITTGKDAVKLDAREFRLPCFVCETSLVFENEKSFTDLLDKALKQTIL